jgi:hypothetical protein
VVIGLMSEPSGPVPVLEQSSSLQQKTAAEAERRVVAAEAEKRIAITDAANRVAAAEAETERMRLRMAEVLDRAAVATGRATELEAALEQARFHAARMAEQNQLLQADLDRERVERINLDERMAFRRLRADQRALIAEMLQTETAAPTVFVTRLADPEANAYATDIVEALRGAGATVVVRDVGSMAPPLHGVVVRVNREGPLVRAFQSARVTHLQVRTPNPAASITVGLKPPNL